MTSQKAKKTSKVIPKQVISSASVVMPPLTISPKKAENAQESPGANSPVESALAEQGACCFTEPEDSSDPGYLSEKRRYLARVKRIEGQVRGIHRMIDEEQYCIDVLTQISAVNSALKSLALTLLDAHLHHCVLHAASSGEGELDAKLEEASAAIARLAK